MNYITAEPFAAVNMPTISKRGESSQMGYTTPETRSAFDASSEYYKFWNTPCQPSWHKSQHQHQLSSSVPEPLPDITNNEMNEWLCFDEDIRMVSDSSPVHDGNHQYFLPLPSSSSLSPATARMDPNSIRRLGSLPVSASHSSQFNPTVFHVDGSSVHYPLDSEQAKYDIYGSEAPFTFFDGRGHFPPEFDLPLKPASQSLTFSDGRPVLPPLLTIPGLNTTQYSAPSSSANNFSPISPVSNFSSPSSSPSSSPELVIQTSIPLHQPRPQRQIPIISLSALATACDGSLNPRLDQKGVREQPPQDLLSPLTLESPMGYDAPTYLPSQSQAADLFLESERDRWKGPGTYPENTRTGVAIACACGCNAAYTLS